MNKYSLKIKILILSGLVITAACAVLTFVSFYQIRNTMKENFINQGFNLAKNLAHNSRYGVYSEDRVMLEELVLGVLQVEEVINVSILNSEGKLLIRKDILGSTYNKKNGLVSTTHWKKVIDSETPVSELVASGKGDDIYYFYVPVTSSWIHASSVPEWLLEENNISKSKNTGLMKLGLVQIGLSTAPLNKQIRRIFLLLFGLTILCAGGAVCLIYLIYTAYVRPLEILTIADLQFSGDNISNPVVNEVREEAGVLTHK
ncbi:MAG: hypothetical protein HZA08_01375 [Nitrospirae bacterium]|nr:hypothetical protein [Nitrospirota bacterium]